MKVYTENSDDFSFYTHVRYFNRDVQCIRTFFLRKFHFTGDFPLFATIEAKSQLDLVVNASGYALKEKDEALVGFIFDHH